MPNPGTPTGSPTPSPLEPDAQTTSAADSAALATEILSIAPQAPVVEPANTGPTTLAEDVTIMAKGRRRRFRLR